MKLVYILGLIMLVIAILTNVVAYFMEKNYKNKMFSISRNKEG